ncbi:hypothetical protein BDV95DRAFT_612471 [Massariosphaeria phaeospora]|uniref:BTB domain-containing protein n=1 Tax=Massariosphaeria phaeospora TaxID=100035 RepID=A0A7C8HYZ3_9PLEO|nr:hypothetical protein BDV95DRAFT_612471 [Massariosphaeria phaeospora]
MPETTEKPLNELLSRSMVDIYVGTENTHWILHEKLLCYHSPFFRKIFYSKTNTSKSFGLPDEEDAPFKTFVGWLYSSSLPVAREEADLGLLFDLYLMAEKFAIPTLIADVLQVVREWYKFSDTYPGLRRVQYVYANTEEGSPMRHMLVHSVARLMVLEKGIPTHWDKALRKNGQLAVDIIRAIQDWRLEEDVVPDARDDPAEAEDMVDTDVDPEAETVVQGGEIDVDGDDEEADEEQEHADDDEQKKDAKPQSQDQTAEPEQQEGQGQTEADDSEDTVVESPKQQSEKTKDGKKNKGDGMISGFKKLGFTEMPSGLTNGDYGTLAH